MQDLQKIFCLWTANEWQSKSRCKPQCPLDSRPSYCKIRSVGDKQRRFGWSHASGVALYFIPIRWVHEPQQGCIRWKQTQKITRQRERNDFKCARTLGVDWHATLNWEIWVVVMIGSKQCYENENGFQVRFRTGRFLCWHAWMKF